MRKVLVFKCVYLGCNIVGGVSGQNWALGLKECCAFVILLVNEVYCDAALCVAALYNGLVHVVAIHALAAVLWKQCRMYVHYFAGVGLYELFGHKQQESCKYNKVNAVLLEQGYCAVGLHEFFLCNHFALYAQSLGALNDVGLRVVADDKGYSGTLFALEIAGNVLGV